MAPPFTEGKKAGEGEIPRFSVTLLDAAHKAARYGSDSNFNDILDLNNSINTSRSTSINANHDK